MPVALQQITLTATESNWRLFMVRRADSAFQTFQNKIFQRDHDTCQFCGFRAKQYQEVINIDGNYYNNRLNNMATACIFCAQCFFLEAVGRSDFGGGTLIYLPEMTQIELNALCHVLFASLVTGNSYSQQSKNTYRGLKLRSQPIEKELGEGMSNPSLLGQLLIDANIEDVAGLKNELAPKIRILPSLTRLAKEVETWALKGLETLAQ